MPLRGRFVQLLFRREISSTPSIRVNGGCVLDPLTREVESITAGAIDARAILSQ